MAAPFYNDTDETNFASKSNTFMNFNMFDI